MISVVAMIFSWFLLSLFSFGVFVYSYGFLDFNLTLTSNPYLLKILSSLQHLVYFQRPLSASIYLFLILGFHLLVFFIWTFYRRSQFPWRWILGISLITALAYPFLSHDIFNYLFYAKEVIHYHQNPHLLPPNHFTGDLWLRFMHWVHVPSPYGYIHTFLLLPIYLLGLGKFVPTLFLLKFANWLFYLAGILAIARLATQLGLDKLTSIRAQLYFALNPLIIIEFLINNHNDAWMLILFLWSLVFLFAQKRLLSFLLVLLAGGIKYITFLTLPFFLPFWFKSKLKLSSKLLISGLTSLLILGVIAFWLFFKFQIWYLLWFTPLLSLLLKSKAQFLLGLFTSYSALIYYYFFISTGFWNREPSFYRSGLMALLLILFFNLNWPYLKNIYLWYNQQHHAS